MNIHRANYGRIGIEIVFVFITVMADVAAVQRLA